MGVIVREKVPGSGKWWIFVNHKKTRRARFVPQGKRKAEEIAAGIIKKLAIWDAAKKDGMTLSVRQVVLDDPNRAVEDPAPKSQTLKAYSEGWIKECEAKGLKHTTLRSYRGSLKNHLLPHFGELPISEIDRKAVKKLALEKLDDEVSTNTVRIILCCLSALFSSAIDVQFFFNETKIKNLVSHFFNGSPVFFPSLPCLFFHLLQLV